MNLVIMIFGLCQHISAITNLHIKSFSYFLKKHIWKISITNLLFQDIFWIEDVVAYEKELVSNMLHCFRQLSLTPCALMLGILYSERLRQLNPSYRERVSSSDLYVISLVRFLHKISFSHQYLILVGSHFYKNISIKCFIEESLTY